MMRSIEKKLLELYLKALTKQLSMLQESNRSRERQQIVKIDSRVARDTPESCGAELHGVVVRKGELASRGVSIYAM
jgi:hypothetical protein